VSEVAQDDNDASVFVSVLYSHCVLELKLPSKALATSNPDVVWQPDTKAFGDPNKDVYHVFPKGFQQHPRLSCLAKNADVWKAQIGHQAGLMPYTD
jgi:hypothetical protein